MHKGALVINIKKKKLELVILKPVVFSAQGNLEVRSALSVYLGRSTDRGWEILYIDTRGRVG